MRPLELCLVSLHVLGKTNQSKSVLLVMESDGPSDTCERKALFVAWLKRNSAGKTLRVCRRKLKHPDLAEDTLTSFPSKICIQRQYGEEFVRLEDRKWADELAKTYEVKVMHHAQRIGLKKDLL